MSVGVAIVLSFGVIRILDGIPSALAKEKRYWPHSVWLALKFLNLFQFWWISWGTRDADWQFLSFLAQLATPVVLYLQASVLTTSSPDSITDWRTHFYATRHRFFGLNVAFAFAIVLGRSLPTGGVPPIPVIVVMSGIVVLSLIGYRSVSHRVQSGVALVAAFSNLVAVATLVDGAAG
jgi:hypothetical protein